jgi:hypothetical protein
MTVMTEKEENSSSKESHSHDTLVAALNALGNIIIKKSERERERERVV